MLTKARQDIEEVLSGVSLGAISLLGRGLDPIGVVAGTADHPGFEVSGASFRLRDDEDVAYLIEAITAAHKLAKLGSTFVLDRAPSLTDSHPSHRRWLAGCEWSDLFGQVVSHIKNELTIKAAFG